jgi:hypothetical protein
MVVIQEFSGSGGRRTRVMIPGTTSEKCLDTKVEMREDLPTPSTNVRRAEKKHQREVSDQESQRHYELNEAGDFGVRFHIRLVRAKEHG